MIPSTIAPISSTPSAASAATSLVPAQVLNQDDFLKLLVTKLTSQDPLNPQQDTDFIAQLAQFNALEQSKTMESDLSQLRNDQQITQANGMLGRDVVVQTGQDTLAQGVVSAIQVGVGTPKIIVNGESYDLSQVRSLTLPATNP